MVTFLFSFSKMLQLKYGNFTCMYQKHTNLIKALISTYGNVSGHACIWIQERSSTPKDGTISLVSMARIMLALALSCVYAKKIKGSACFKLTCRQFGSNVLDPTVYMYTVYPQPTLAGRCTSRPHSCSLTNASSTTASNELQVEACITTVGGSVLICCSSSVTNLAIGWVSQIATVHHCKLEEHICVTVFVV